MKKTHLLFHLQKPKWCCENCGEVFSQEQKLRSHQRKGCTVKHKATKDCKCPGCGKMYFSEKSVKRHQKRFCKKIPMEDVLLFKCDNCSKAFKTKGNFTKHQKTCVKKPCKNTNKDSYKCGSCD